MQHTHETETDVNQLVAAERSLSYVELFATAAAVLMSAAFITTMVAAPELSQVRVVWMSWFVVTFIALMVYTVEMYVRRTSAHVQLS